MDTTDAAEKKPEVLSHYRLFNRNYTKEELLGEIKNLLEEDGYEDFLFIASGPKGFCSRIGSEDQNLRNGDILYLLKCIEKDVGP
jgi:hypothetical protein